MSEGLLFFMTIADSLLGFFLNRAYAKQYGEAAVQWGPFALQLIFTGAVLANLPGDELSYGLIICLIGLAASYVFGWWKCWKHAKGQNAGGSYIAAALTAQAVLPLGLALAVMLAAGVIVFGILWEH